MRIIFAIVLLAHALFHLMGVAKAFKPVQLPEFSQNISKPVGILWLLCSLLLFTSFLLFVAKNGSWSSFALGGLLLSQLVIGLSWGDAKYGTIINLILLAATLSALGNSRFINKTEKETKAVLEKVERSPHLSEANDFHSLPPIVQKWMVTTGASKKGNLASASLEQSGKLRTKPNGKWMPFTAQQHTNLKNPSFIWTTRVKPFPPLFLSGRDKFVDGKGEMLIKFLSLFKVVHEKGNDKIDSGSMLRFLGEICWFPTAATEKYINWQEVDATSAEAFLKIDEKQVSGIFRFSEDGKIKSFEAWRYRGSSPDAKKEKWVIDVVGYKSFEGMEIPAVCKVTWKSPNGDFEWLHLEIDQLEYHSLPVASPKIVAKNPLFES